MKKLTAISLYTGAGGLDYGFEAAGFRTAVAVENNAVCTKTLRDNRRWSLIPKSIQAVSTREILEKGRLRKDDVDIVIGGPPCQPFSKSGYWATGETRRLDDPRASTIESFLRVVEETRPRSFLMENVEGLGFRGKDEGLTHIIRRLDQINADQGTHYRLCTDVLNAADYGVPQLRKRLFLIAARDGRRFTFPEKGFVPRDDENPTRKPLHRTAWDALHKTRLRKADGDLALRGKWADLLPTIPEGRNYLWHTERGGGEPLFGWRRRYWSFLLKLAKDQPSWTIQAQPGPATGPFHWSNRRLSVREMARLQTFPKDVTISGDYADAQRQLGNAVPSLLAEVLAREISCQLLDRCVRGVLQLATPPAAIPPLPPELPKAVPARYTILLGLHEAHPGTGKGYRAASRGSDFAGPPQNV